MTYFVFRLRRDTAFRWLNKNPILDVGEPGFENDTGRLKIGDGYKTWTELGYFVPIDSNQSTLSEHINSEIPHPVYDNGPSLVFLYENAKV